MLRRSARLHQFAQNWPSAIVLGMLGVLYVPLLLHWVNGWLNKNISIEHEYYSHGLIGLPLAAYLAWNRRDRWHQLPNQTHLLGVICLVGGVVLYGVQLPDALNLSFPLVLLGLCLWLKGIPGMQLMGFPLLLVGLATPTPIPYLLTPYTLPLQRLIALIVALILMQLGMDVRVEQIYLFVNGQIVEIAPYCAGLKMLFSSFYVSLILLYWTGAWASRSKTITFLVSVVLVSTTANIIRNTLLSYFHGTGRSQAFDWLHDGWGGDLYSACALGGLVFLLRGVEWAIALWSPVLLAAGGTYPSRDNPGSATTTGATSSSSSPRH